MQEVPMTQRLNIDDPTVTMDAVVAQVRHGEEVVLLDHGRPIARAVPISATSAPRIPGLNRGAITVDDTFDDPLPDAFWLGDA
jgi:antitoxin (DNA-binding transcriptional repressor) of toxin-antitoxin stability system